jgi:uncharacterized 2Fe-2S/4Fe-4S cluster protein (DUF4445 family)
VDGAITKVEVDGDHFKLTTIADAEPVGLTGSGLLSAIAEFRRVGLIDPSGRINPACDQYSDKVENGEADSIEHPGSTSGTLPPECERFADQISKDDQGARRIQLTPDKDLYLTQLDIRELQKAKGAIRAAIDVLMNQLELKPEDMEEVILTGSFGGQVDIDAILEIGMIPPVKREAVKTIANGAGLGAAMFLTDEGFALAEKLAQKAEQVDLDLDPQFNRFYVEGMTLAPYKE